LASRRTNINDDAALPVPRQPEREYYYRKPRPAGLALADGGTVVGVSAAGPSGVAVGAFAEAYQGQSSLAAAWRLVVAVTQARFDANPDDGFDVWLKWVRSMARRVHVVGALGGSVGTILGRRRALCR
jgi:hypothetical protein